MEKPERCGLASSPNTICDNKTEEIKEILKRNNIHDSVSEVTIKGSELKGDSLGSVTSFVSIKFEDAHLAPLHLFLKRMPEDSAQSAMIIESKQFIKEALFFTEYLPEVQKLCKKLRQENLMNIYPKCYYADDKLIVLENLIEDKGYIILNKEELQDFDAAQFALTTLAKHHAISYAYVKKIGGPQQFLKRFVDLNFLCFDAESMRKSMVPFVEDPVVLGIKILSRSNLTGKNEAIEILKGYQTNTHDKFMEPLKRNFKDDDGTLRILNHGDYWNSNMMFHKDKLDGNKFDGHIMIDFAVLNFNTPGVDIGYYLFTSVKPAVRQANLEKLLEIYRNVFVKTTCDLGYSIELTYDGLFRDFRETFIHGFLIGLGICTGIGFTVLGDADPTGIEFEEWASNYSKLLDKWIDDNPDKIEETAKTLISVLEEHQNLIL